MAARSSDVISALFILVQDSLERELFEMLEFLLDSLIDWESFSGGLFMSNVEN